MSRAMKDSGVAWIGEIPEDWDIARLKSIFSFAKGLPITKDNLEETGVPVISYGQIHAKFNSGVRLQKELLRFVNKSYIQTNSECLVHCGDIIVADTSEDIDGCGNSAYVDKEMQLFAGYHTIVLKTKDSTENKYYAYLMKTDPWRSQIRAKVSGVKVFSISRKILADTTLICPPTDEQSRIATYLDGRCAEIDRVIAATQRTIEEYKKLKQSIITEAVTHGVRGPRKMKDSGVEWIGEIPENWELSTIGEKIVFEGGSQPPLIYFEHEPLEGYVRLIQNRDYKTDAYITYVPITSVSKFCTEDDVMIGRYGPPMFVMHRGLKGAYNVALMKAIPQGIDREWMSFVLQNYTLLSYIESFSKRAAGQDGVNPRILKKYPLPLPDINEQKEIASFLEQRCDEIEHLIDNKQQLITQLESYKKSVIYEYVTGKREVPECQ